MSAQDRWIFTKEQLRRVPSITESNMSVENELLNRQQAAKLCQEMGQKLKVSQWVINTGITFLHRFYCRHSFAKYPFKTMAPTSLFLAAKVEEQPRKLEHIIKVSQICIYRENVDPKSERYQSLAAQLVYSENLMLRTLGFDLNIQHAHTSIVNCCQLVRATKNIAETSYYLATNSLHLSTLCLQYKPTVVACICIYFVCKWSNFLIPKSHEGKEWWTYIDDTVNKEMLEGLMSECLQIFQKCPQRLKKSFTDNSKMNSISNSSSNNSNTNNITASATITNSSSSSNSNNKIHMISQHVKQQHFQPTGALPSIPPKPATAIVPATTPSFSNSSLLSATSLASSSSKDKSISKLENNVFSSLFSINENSQNSLNHSMNNMNSSTSMTLNFDLNSLNHTMDSSSLLNPDSDSLNHTFDASSLNADMDSNHTMDASYATDSISFNHNSGDASSNIDAVSQQEHTPVEAPASTLTTETADDSSDHSKKHKKKHKHKEKHKHKDKHKHKHKDKDKEKEKEKHREKYNVEPSFQIQQQPETGSKVAPLKLKILTTKRSRDELGDSSPVEDEGKIQPIKIKFSALSNHQRSSPESPDNIDLPVSRKRKRSDKKDIKKALKQVFSDLEANIDN